MAVQKTMTYRGDATEVKDMDVVVVYGDVLGTIEKCKNVIIINGDVKGNVIGCKNITGLPADNRILTPPKTRVLKTDIN